MSKPLTVPVPYPSALAICRATDEELRYPTLLDPVTLKHSVAVECLFKGKEGKANEWVKVFETQPHYDTPEAAVAAITKFVNGPIREKTPWSGREWPLEKGPVPHGFTIVAGPKGERILARPQAKRVKGSNFTKPRR